MPTPLYIPHNLYSIRKVGSGGAGETFAWQTLFRYCSNKKFQTISRNLFARGFAGGRAGLQARFTW